MDEDSPGTLEEQIVKTQKHYQQAMTILQEQDLAYPTTTSIGTFWKDKIQHRLIIPKDKELHRQVADTWHNDPTGGPPGRDETTRRINDRYFWPGARTWIADYVKGCATCQQNKNLAHRIKASLYRIPVPTRPAPFKHVALDLITGLPKSRGFDAILTIVDHGCSRAAIFLPCHTTITGP